MTISIKEFEPSYIFYFCKQIQTKLSLWILTYTCTNLDFHNLFCNMCYVVR